jgi:hypothetical protein
MYSLRVLKKLSKRAAPLLASLGDDRKQFRAERGESYIGIVIMGRKHWERSRSVHADGLRQREIITKARRGNGYIRVYPPSQPLKGTVMVGAVSGCYDPEWDEESAWEALEGIVSDYFTEVEYNEDGIDRMWLTRPLNIPADYFAAADEIIKAQGKDDDAR